MIWDDFFEWLMVQEGKEITDDPRDPGGHTAWGISRRYHPDWPGWAMIDSGITSGPEFEDMVSAFYRETYQGLWTAAPVRVREVLTDTAINMGSTYAVQLMQDAMNHLAGVKYVVVDGKLGPLTVGALKRAEHDGLAFTMCALRMAEYNRRARRDQNKRVFLSGWLNRVHSLMGVI